MPDHSTKCAGGSPRQIYTGTSAHELVALNASDGTPVWHFPARFSLGPVVADDTIYVSDHTMVYAVPA